VIGARRSEYRTVSSGLGPLDDAITRAGLTRDDVNLCLLVGGSVDLPGLEEGISAFLPRAQLLRYHRQGDPDGRAIARGAALHALSIAVTGRGLVQPLCGDKLALRTQSGSMMLVEQGTPLPFPGAGRRSIGRLAVPQSSEDEPVSLRVEVVAGEDERIVFAETWAILAPMSEGERLLADVRMDENQVLELRLRRAEPSRGKPFEGQIENPLTNMINPTEQELEAERIEADFAARRVPAEDQRAAALRLSQLLDELGPHEKAMDWLRRLQAQSGRVDPRPSEPYGDPCSDHG
jgi:hypothetical protein